MYIILYCRLLPSSQNKICLHFIKLKSGEKVNLYGLATLKKHKTFREFYNKYFDDSELKNILVYSDIPLVSVDYNHTPASSYFDSLLTKVSSSGDLVKVFGWYDNEYGFSCRMLDTAVAMMNAN